MAIEQVLRMNGGLGKTSYATNSSHPRTVISMVKPILEESIVKLYRTKKPHCLAIADLGCSVGPNTLLVISQIVDIIVNAWEELNQSPPPSLQVFLNDLPGNDFNTVFMSWTNFHKKIMEDKKRNFGQCFMAGVPGSFYSRLFPDNSLHFFHSSYALMWISQAPKVCNKENIYIAKSSPLAVHKAYFDQFQRDFRIFLKHRAEELVPEGQMVLTTMGSIKSEDPLCIWEFVGLKIHDMVLADIIEEEKLESFNIQYYAPTEEEIKSVVEAEGSFTLQKFEAFKMDWDTYIKKVNPELNKKERSAIIAKDIRAVGEPVLSSHFGQAIMDDLFQRFEEDVLDYMNMNQCKYINLVLSLTKKA